MRSRNIAGRHPWTTRWLRCAEVLVAAVALTASAVTTASASPTSGGGAGGPASKTSSAACGSVLFRDSFNQANDPAWTFVNRAGRVAGGRLVIDGGYLPGAADRDGWALTHVGAQGWRNYSFTASFDTTNPGGSPPEAHMAMFFLRVMGPATYYKIITTDPGQPDPRGGPVLKNGLVQLFRVVDGAYTLIKDVERSNTVVGSNRIHVSLVGSKIAISLNGKWIMTGNDPSPLLSGGVGVGEIWETNGSFDDVLVRRAC